MGTVSEAIHFATDAFNGKSRKCSKQPAILHSLETAVIAASMTENEEVISAAVLHDVAEDAGITFEELREKFGERIMMLVKMESEDKRRHLPPAQTWRIRKEEAIALLRNTKDQELKILFLADKLSNVRALYIDLKKEGADLWNHFNQKDPEQHHWYFRSVADALPELKETPAWQEYDRLIAEVFQEGS